MFKKVQRVDCVSDGDYKVNTLFVNLFSGDAGVQDLNRQRFAAFVTDRRDTSEVGPDQAASFCSSCHLFFWCSEIRRWNECMLLAYAYMLLSFNGGLDLWYPE
jgi:hypothetical protein